MLFHVIVTGINGKTKIVDIQAENLVEAGIIAEKIYDNNQNNLDNEVKEGEQNDDARTN